MANSGDDVIPRDHAHFDLFQNNFVTVVNANKAGWDLSTTATTEWNTLTTTINVKKKRWDTIWAVVNTKIFTHADEVELLEARKDYESGDPSNSGDTSIRIFIARYIRNNLHVTSEQKKLMGLTVPTFTRTPTDETNARLEIEVVGKVKSLKHLLQINEVREPGKTNVARDKGISEIDVFIAFTDGSVKTAPAITAFQIDGDVKRGLYHRSFTADQEGLRAWYIARKRMKGKDKKYGPPSDPWSSLIP